MRQSMQHSGSSLSTGAVGAATHLTLTQRALLLALAVGVFVTDLWPTWYVRDAVLNAFGAPAYEGIWILIPHALLYSTLCALVALALWLWLARARWMGPASLAFNSQVVAWGVLGGVVVIAITVVALYALGYGGIFHAPRVDPWVMAGNAFSNFFEELIFRGFLLAALAAALGFWFAAILSSIAFGAVHTQYPFELQVLVGVGGCRLVPCRRARQEPARSVHFPYDAGLAHRSVLVGRTLGVRGSAAHLRRSDERAGTSDFSHEFWVWQIHFEKALITPRTIRDSLAAFVVNRKQH